jgi:hypothetical protein
MNLLTTMDSETLQLLNNRITNLEMQINKDSFSSVDVYRKYLNVANRLKIPVISADPSEGNIGDIIYSGTTFKICTATTPTWTSIVTLDGSGKLPAVDGSQLTNLPSPTQIISNFTAGETLALGDPVRVSLGTTTLYSQTNTGNADTIKYDSTYSGKADKIIINEQGAKVITVSLRLYKVGSPGDNLQIQLVNDNGDTPTGSVIETVNQAGSSLTLSAAVYDYTFTSVLDAGTYWIKMTRSGGSDETNFYVISSLSESASSYARYAANSNAWTTTNATRSYLIITYTDGTAGQIVKALADKTFNSKVIGLTNAIITSGNSGNVVSSGVITGLGSLSPGNLYYLSNVGTITNSKGTKTVPVGIALTSTTLLINIQL